MKYLLGCLMAAFFVSTAQAQIQGRVVGVPVFCAFEPGALEAEVASEGKTKVWSKKDFGGGTMSIYQNVETGEWSLLREKDGITCKVASNAKREVGS